MDPKMVEWLIAAPLLLGLFLFVWWAQEESHRRLDDPNDDRTLYLDQLPTKLLIHPFGVYRVTLLRQSGNIHAEHIVTGSAQDALATALTTLRRAGIPAVHVAVNTNAELRVGRLYHNHRGSNEGRKVGGAHIVLMQRASVSHPNRTEPTLTVQRVTITCDCGARTDVAFDAIRTAQSCIVCGEDNTLTADQIAKLDALVDEMRAEALDRFASGETAVSVERKVSSIGSSTN